MDRPPTAHQTTTLAAACLAAGCLAITFAAGCGDADRPDLADATAERDATHAAAERRQQAAEPLVSAELSVGATAGDARSVAMASDGTNYLVAWQDNRNPESTGVDIWAALLQPSGELVGGAPFVVSRAEGPQTRPAVAFNGELFLVAWEDARVAAEAGGEPPFPTDIFAARVQTDGHVLDPQGIRLTSHASTQSEPAVAAHDELFYIAWRDARREFVQADPTVGGDIHLGAITAAGGLGDVDSATAATDATVARASGIQRAAALVASEHGVLVTWEDRRADTGDAYAAWLPDGDVAAMPAPFAVSKGSGRQWSPQPIFDGQDLVVSWLAADGVWTQAYGVPDEDAVAPEPLLRQPRQVARLQQPAAELAAAFNGRSHLLTWHQPRGGEAGDIFGLRLTPHLDPIEQAPFGLTQSLGGRFGPAVAAGPVSRWALGYTIGPETAPDAAARLLSFEPGPPVGADRSAETPEDTPVSLVLGRDDLDYGYEIVDAPEHGTLSGQPPQVTYTPEPDFHGADRFAFRVSATGGGSVEHEAAVTVAPVNDPPVFLQPTPPEGTVYELEAGQTLAFRVVAYDADGDDLAYSVRDLPAGATFDPQTGEFRWTAETGADEVWFVGVSDGETLVERAIIVRVTGGGDGCSCTSVDRRRPLGALGVVAMAGLLGWAVRRRRYEDRRQPS